MDWKFNFFFFTYEYLSISKHLIKTIERILNHVPLNDKLLYPRRVKENKVKTK